MCSLCARAFSARIYHAIRVLLSSARCAFVLSRGYRTGVALAESRLRSPLSLVLPRCVPMSVAIPHSACHRQLTLSAPQVSFHLALRRCLSPSPPSFAFVLCPLLPLLSLVACRCCTCGIGPCQWVLCNVVVRLSRRNGLGCADFIQNFLHGCSCVHSVLCSACGEH